MRVQYMLTCMFFCMLNFHLSAQKWETPSLIATELQNGSVYYVQNTGLNLRIADGAAWGTQAVLKANGLAATVRFNASTNLYVLEFPGKDNTLFRSDLAGNVYTDQTKDNKWDIQLKDAENLIYTIQAPASYSGYNANQYLGSTGQRENNDYILKYNRNKDQYAEYIEWQFLNLTLYDARQALYQSLIHASSETSIDLTAYTTVYETSKDPIEVRDATKNLDREVIDDLTKEASPLNPIDLTYYLVNPNFNNNNAEGWTVEGAVTVNYHEVESYERIFNMFQKVTGLPAGKYILKAQGFERPKANDRGTAYAAGTESIHARLYAKSDVFSEISTPFNSLYKHSYSGDGTSNGYVNNMASAERAFSDGHYEIVLADIMLAEDDVLTIGAKTDFQQSNYWVLFDNFRIEYEGLDIDEFVALAQQQILVAQDLEDSKMQHAVRGNLTSAVVQLQHILDAQPLAMTDFYEAYEQLLKVTEVARISILAYDNLQIAIDSALVVYADGAGSEAAVFRNAIDTAEGIADNFDLELDDIYNATSEMYLAIFANRLANATGTAPRVITNTNYARGATSIFARLIGGSGAGVVERGFCWSTHPEPTVLDNRTTEFFNHNGNIYHIKDLKPSTVYYIRAYAMTKTYAVGYGDIIKVITIPKGTVTFTLNASVTNSGEHYPRIHEAVATAVDYFNNYTSIQGHHLSVNHHAGTPTAEASYGGYMQFGANPSYQRTGTALHEMGHTVGVGQHNIWYGGSSPLRAGQGRGDWLGDRANKVVQFFENNASAKLTGDDVHMWPYGINGAHEDSGNPVLYIVNSLIHQGLGEDGLPPTGGFTTPAYTFESEDTIKYYIKIEDERLGRNTSYLVENSVGRLVLKTMSGEESLANDSAAWYFQFNPKTCYYTIRNVSTGKYFSYKNIGANGITLAEKTTPASTETFQMMMSRVNSIFGTGRDRLITRSFWIVRPERNLNPPALSAQINGSSSATTFNLSNSASTQRWYILTENEVELFEKAFPSVSKNEEMTVSPVIIYTENQQLQITNIIEPSDLVVYDVSGRLQLKASGVSGYYSTSLSEGVYFVTVSNKQSVITKKVVVR